MKNKGFTLLELLGVVIILGVLALITFPIILNQVKNSKDGIKDSTRVLIIDAAKDYYEDNTNNYDKIEGMTYCINISTLTDNNYLNKNIKNENLNSIDTNKDVKMVYHNNKFEYDIVDSCNNNSLTRNNIEVPIVSENSGLYKSTTDTDRFIYRGGTPNNWIWLDENGDGIEASNNSEFYRIISFENDGTIKVTRNKAFASAWDVESGEHVRNNSYNSFCIYDDYIGCNAWSNTANTLYNGVSLDDLNRNFYYEFYDESMNLVHGNQNGTVSDEAYLNLYLNDTWYNSKSFGNIIVEHLFNVSGPGYWNTYNGGDKGIKKEKYEESLFKWKGKVGLPSVTEYIESSTNINCTSVYSNYSYNKNIDVNSVQPPCSTNENWLKINNSYIWLISSFVASNRGLWYVTSSGWFGNGGNPSNAYYVRPSFYLKSSISLIGEGTEESPYRIVGEA